MLCLEIDEYSLTAAYPLHINVYRGKCALYSNNAYLDKAKPIVRWGRKDMGLMNKIAGLPYRMTRI